MLVVFNRFMGIMFDLEDEAKAIRCAACNAACVVDQESGKVLADFRTEESEADERG